MVKVITLNIAGFRMGIEGSQIEKYLQQVPGLSVFVDNSASENDVVVEFGDEPSKGIEYERLNEFMLADDYVKCYFGRKDDCYVFEMHPMNGDFHDFVLLYDKKQHCKGTLIENTTMLRFALWMTYCMAAMKKGISPIHSSTIEYHGKAILFLGESGTGKSTHTRLWLENIEGARLLNDDSPIISCQNGRVMVSGSPWSGKTHCYHNKTFPLAAVVRLEQAKVNEIHKLGVLNAIAALQPSLPPSFAYDEYYANKILDITSEIVEHVPVYKLRCLPNAEAAKLSFKTVIQ